MHRWRKRLYLASIAILFVGMCAATAIYLRAEDSSDFNGAYQVEIINGVAYPTAPSDSRAYQRELERIGGKSYVLFDDLNRWIASLFHGRTLAITVGVSTFTVSIALFLLGRFVA